MVSLRLGLRDGFIGGQPHRFAAGAAHRIFGVGSPIHAKLERVAAAYAAVGGRELVVIFELEPVNKAVLGAAPVQPGEQSRTVELGKNVRAEGLAKVPVVAGREFRPDEVAFGGKLLVQRFKLPLKFFADTGGEEFFARQRAHRRLYTGGRITIRLGHELLLDCVTLGAAGADVTFAGAPRHQTLRRPCTTRAPKSGI